MPYNDYFVVLGSWSNVHSFKKEWEFILRKPMTKKEQFKCYLADLIKMYVNVNPKRTHDKIFN